MKDPQPTPAKLLATPVQYLKGVGPERAELLHRLELHTVADVLFYFPRDYQDFTDEREIGRLEEGKLQTVRGVVDDIELRTSQSGRAVLGVLIRSGTDYLRALWFNQPFMREKFDYGQRVAVSGKPKYEGLMWQMHHPRVETLADDEEEPAGKILPVYPLTEGLQQWQMRRIVSGAVENYVESLDEVFPAEYRQSHKLWPIRQALPQIHFPSDRESLDHARRRFVYQELLVLQLALAVKRRRQHDQRRSPALEATALIDARIRRLFPFELTEGQRQAIAEIARDMAGPLSMNRLLQGEVGSGKTVVAVYAMLLAVAHGYQAVLMAPTEVLARQHVLTLDKLLASSRVRRAQLTGGLPGGQRGAIAANCRRRSGHGRRHSSDHPGRRFVCQARAGGNRRAAQVRRAAASDVEILRTRPALPGDDRHAHPADDRADAVRRSRRIDFARLSAGQAKSAYLFGGR